MLEPATAQKTIVAFLLDRTGSMAAIKAETIGGFNAYLDRLEREAGDLIEFTLLQFDSEGIDRLHVGARLAEVKRLTDEAYQPRAYTPLVDACVETIKAAEDTVARRRDNPRVIVVFQTDGAENASRHHTLEELRGLIARRKAEGWLFVFLGADIDAYAAARGLGIDEASTLAYLGRFTGSAFEESARVFGRVARGQAREVRFSARQKRAAGDRDGAAAEAPETPSSTSGG